MEFFEIKIYDVEINAKGRTPEDICCAAVNICDNSPRTIAKFADKSKAEKAWANIVPDVLSFVSAPVSSYRGKVYELNLVEYDDNGDYIAKEDIASICPILPPAEIES